MEKVFLPKGWQYVLPKGDVKKVSDMSLQELQQALCHCMCFMDRLEDSMYCTSELISNWKKGVW